MGRTIGNAELRTERARVHVYTYRYDTPSHDTRSPGRDVLALCADHAPGAAGFFRAGGTTSQMFALGGLMIIPAGTSISAMGPGGDRRLAVCTMTNGILPGDFDRSDPRRLALCSDIRDANIRGAMQRMAAEAAHPGFAAEVLIDGLAATLRIDLARYFTRVDGCEAENRGTLAPWQLRRLEEYVQAADGGRLRIADLASIAEVSPGHLSRTFKKSTGRTLHQFVEAARLARARAMLSDTRMPLKQIAARLGFSSPSSFSLAFRRAAGTTPGRFRGETATIN